MATDPRLALVRLVDALESFHDVAVTATDPEDAAVYEAADRLSDAYIVYDDVMFTQFGVELPFDLFEESEEDSDVVDSDDDDREDDDLDEDDDLEENADDLDDDSDIDDIDDDLFG